MRKIIPPKEDECLKNLMENEVVRRHFISQVTGIPLEEIRLVRLMNTFLRRRYRKRKLGIVDVLVELNDDAKINIEMQIVRYAGWDRARFILLSVWRRKWSLPTLWGQCSSRSRICRQAASPCSRHGWVCFPMRSRSILISADIRIWLWDSGKCSALSLRRISIIRIYQRALQNSGEGGIFP